MKLTRNMLDWSLLHIMAEGDTDLLPTPFEFQVIKKQWTQVRTQLANVDITHHVWSGPRRLVVPKAEFAFRSVCQLDPLDALIFAGIIRSIGGAVEKRRVPISSERVFSYRFKPTDKGQYYARDNGWEKFWSKSLSHAGSFNYVLVTDISDFYNQIYHHTVENQLNESKIDKALVKNVLNFLASTTEGVSKGVPIGPHGGHILAEASLAPLDNFIMSKGITHCRYVDDFHLFFDIRQAAQKALFGLVEYLDKTQKLQLNKSKTAIYAAAEFATIAKSQAIDNPINAAEESILKVLKTTPPILMRACGYPRCLDRTKVFSIRPASRSFSKSISTLPRSTSPGCGGCCGVSLKWELQAVSIS